MIKYWIWKAAKVVTLSVSRRLDVLVVSRSYCKIKSLTNLRRSSKPFETSPVKTDFNTRRFASSIISLTFDSTVQEVRQLIESIFLEAS